MTKARVGLLTLAGLAVVATGIVGVRAPAVQAQSANTASAQYNPRVGDLMNMIVQPRHAKLGLAGAAGNWPLARYALAQLQQALKTVGDTWPTFSRLSLPDMIESTTAEPFKALDLAIKARDPAQFRTAYAQLTAACNSCHAALNHPFVVIKVPDQSPFPDQEFAPAAK